MNNKIEALPHATNKKEEKTLAKELRVARSLISLSIGQVVTVGIAHTFQKHYGWSDYSESNYIIEKISRKEIIGRSERCIHEGIRISRKDLDSGRFELRI